MSSSSSSALPSASPPAPDSPLIDTDVDSDTGGDDVELAELDTGDIKNTTFDPVRAMDQYQHLRDIGAHADLVDDNGDDMPDYDFHSSTVESRMAISDRWKFYKEHEEQKDYYCPITWRWPAGELEFKDAATFTWNASIRDRINRLTMILHDTIQIPKEICGILIAYLMTDRRGLRLLRFLEHRSFQIPTDKFKLFKDAHDSGTTSIIEAVGLPQAMYMPSLLLDDICDQSLSITILATPCRWTDHTPLCRVCVAEIRGDNRTHSLGQAVLRPPGAAASPSTIVKPIGDPVRINWSVIQLLTGISDDQLAKNRHKIRLLIEPTAANTHIQVSINMFDVKDL